MMKFWLIKSIADLFFDFVDFVVVVGVGAADFVGWRSNRIVTCACHESLCQFQIVDLDFLLIWNEWWLHSKCVEDIFFHIIISLELAWIVFFFSQFLLIPMNCSKFYIVSVFFVFVVVAICLHTKWIRIHKVVWFACS